jgi:hypothetical protein
MVLKLAAKYVHVKPQLLFLTLNLLTWGIW